MRPNLVALTGILAAATCMATAPEMRAQALRSELREIAFPSGMRAVIARTPPVPGREPRVFAGLYVAYGTSAARPELAHLVEHIVANNRPLLFNYSPRTGAREFGGNAMTRPDYMSFWRTVTPDRLEEIVANRANRILGVQDDSTIFAREVQRVASETERGMAREAAEGMAAARLLRQAFFGPLIPREALLDSLRSYDRSTVRTEASARLRTGNAVLVLAGDLDLDSAEAVVRRNLEKFPAQASAAPVPGPAIVRNPGDLVIRDGRTARARVGIGLSAPPRDSRNFLAFLILDQLLLGGREIPTDSAIPRRSMSSPLGRLAASELGASSIDDGTFYATDPPPLAIKSPSYLAAYFDAGADVPPDSVVPRVRRTLAATLERRLSDEEIRQAKEALVRFLDRWMMSPDLLYLGDHLAAFTLLDGTAKRLSSIEAEINSIDAGAVRALARRYARPGESRVVAVLPAK